jgi:hypothetical protein
MPRASVVVVSSQRKCMKMKSTIPSAVFKCFLVFCLIPVSVSRSGGHASDGASPHYVWRNVAIRGGGFVTGIVTHPKEKGLMYARTDVGGAYRWDEKNGCWIPLTDWIGMEDANLTGIESLAVDPSNPECVYLAAGTYTNTNAGNGAVLRSRDRGLTFKRTDMPFKMGGNEAGRFHGERLAVDPNRGSVLFFGSRSAGLWKSADSGATWLRVETFPALAASKEAGSGDFWNQPVGVVFVQFIAGSGRPGNPTPVLFAGISVQKNGLQSSMDGGITWTPVPGQPAGLRPNHAALSADGSLYLSYGKEPGPNAMTNGAVWKFNLGSGVWTDVTPVRPDSACPFGYGGVSTDASRPETVMTTTFCRWNPGDEVFRTVDGGKTWKPLLTRAVWDRSNAPWTEKHTPHWMGDVEIDPFDSNHALFTTGYGVWASRNISDADSDRPVRWTFDDVGLEETVPLGLISPPEGAHLLSALGDIDGFRHDDLDVPRLQFTDPPRFANTEDIAFAGKNSGVIVRVGTVRTRRPGRNRGAVSKDGGRTWTVFASEPPNSAGAGTVSISADGGAIVWTPRRGAPHFSRDGGASWNPCVGLSAGLKVTADRVDSNRFYAFDSRAGRLYMSEDGALSFSAALGSSLPDAGAFPGGFGGSGGPGGSLVAAPDRRGDLWVSCRTLGLYHSTDSGANFSKAGGVDEAYSLGFGKPAPGKKDPALFLAGKVLGVQGLFRSDDYARTWIRIDDDRHRFGWVNHVTGDPRVYGRVYFGTGGRGIIYGDPVDL